MLPVTISLGLINFNLLINSFFGTLVSDQAPGGDRQGLPHLHAAAGDLLGRGRDRALPDPGAVRRPRRRSTTCGRRWRTGCARSCCCCVPAAAAILVLSEPMIRLVYQRGEFDASQTDLVATALFWFAFSLPFNGLFLLLTRTFFSLQRPWMPTAISGANLAITAGRGSRSTRRSASAGSSPRPRSRPPPASSPRLWSCAARSAGSSSAASCGRRPGCSWPRRSSPRSASGSGTGSTMRSGGGSRARSSRWAPALLVGAVVYAATVTVLRIPEAAQIYRLVRGRLVPTPRRRLRGVRKQSVCDGAHRLVDSRGRSCTSPDSPLTHRPRPARASTTGAARAAPAQSRPTHDNEVMQTWRACALEFERPRPPRSPSRRSPLRLRRCRRAARTTGRRASASPAFRVE